MSVGKQEKKRVAKKHKSKKTRVAKPKQAVDLDAAQLDRAAAKLESASNLDADRAHAWYSPKSTFGIGILWVALMWFAFPPVGLWPLGWIATAPLLWLVQRKKLPSKKPYRHLLMVGFIYWLASLYFIPIPHWALFFGWITVSIYLAVYTPLFVACSRVMVHRFKIPLMLAAPVAWVGLEWIRCVAFTGQGMVCLSHSQYTQAGLIQVADLSGAYTLSFALVAFAACYVRFFFYRGAGESKPHWRFAISGLAVLGIVFGYGAWRLNEAPAKVAATAEGLPQLKLALIQGSVDTNLRDLEAVKERKESQYSELTWRAREQWADLDLVVWPEGNLPFNDWLPETDYTKLTGDLAGIVDQDIRDSQFEMWRKSTGSKYKFRDPVCFIAGTGCVLPDVEKIYNGALFFDTNGMIEERYFKNHLVMIGEYTPFLDLIPFMKAFPISDTSAGTEAKIFEVKGIKLAPNICFETTVPHLIRRQLNELRESGDDPDVMLNLTNDGWFYGTSCLDLHLACNVFRAVEMRKPNLVCANTGLSAEIDRYGRVIQKGPRRGMKLIRCVVTKGGEPTVGFYRTIGDGIPISFALVVLISGLLALKERITSTSPSSSIHDLSRAGE